MEHLLNAFTATVKLKYPDFELPRLSQVEHAIWKLIHHRPPHLLPPGDASWDEMLATRARLVAENCNPSQAGLQHAPGERKTRLPFSILSAGLCRHGSQRG